MMYGEGVNKAGEAIDLGIKFGLVNKSGAWLTFTDPKEVGAESDKVGQGRDSARAFLTQNPKILEKLIYEIKERARRQKEESDPSQLEG